MKFIADVGFPASGVAALRDRGHDVLALTEEKLERLPDDEIVVLTRRTGRAVLAFDIVFLVAAHHAARPGVKHR